MKKAIGTNTPRGTVPRHTDGYNTDCDELQQVDMYSHQKYMTISGHYGDDTSRVAGVHRVEQLDALGHQSATRSSCARPGRRTWSTQWNRNFDFIWNNRSRPVGASPGPSFDPTPPVCTSTALVGEACGDRAATEHDLAFSGRFWESD